MLRTDHLRTLLGEWRKIARRVPQGPAASNRIVFVGGVQRSGTNMVMELLEYSPDTKVFHERDPRVFRMFAHNSEDAVRRQAKSFLPCIVFKALSDSHRIAHLMSLFPQSCALWVYRHYERVNASNLVRWPGDKNGLDQIVVDRSASDWRGAGMTDKTLRLVREHYRPDLSVASAQALFWYYRNQLFFDQHFDENDQVLVVRYENLLQHPPDELRRLREFLEIRIPDSAMSHVSANMAGKTPSLDIEPSIRALCEAMMTRLDAVLARQLGTA